MIVGTSQPQIFLHLVMVTRFPKFLLVTFFPVLELINCFPALGVCNMLSRAWSWLHVFPRLL